MGANGPPGVVAAILNPRGMVGRIYIVNHYALQHINIEAVRFMVSEDFLRYFPFMINSGRGQFGPKGHGWHDSCRKPPYTAIY